jgi:hypothetical protein
MKYFNLLLCTAFIVAGILALPENYGVGFAIIFIGAWIGGYAFFQAFSSEHRANLEARYRTADVRFVELVKGSDADTMHLVKLHLSAMLRIFPWANGWVTVIGSTGVPKGFAAEFLRKGDNVNLPAISSWSDKSLWVEPGSTVDFGECRALAYELTEYLLDMGIAKRSFANIPPRYVDGVGPSLLRAAWGIPLSIHKQDDLRPANELHVTEEVSA